MGEMKKEEKVEIVKKLLKVLEQEKVPVKETANIVQLFERSVFESNEIKMRELREGMLFEARFPKWLED